MFFLACLGKRIDLLTFGFLSPCWSIFSHGPKRFTFYTCVLWATEFVVEEHKTCGSRLRGGDSGCFSGFPLFNNSLGSSFSRSSRALL